MRGGGRGDSSEHTFTRQFGDILDSDGPSSGREPPDENHLNLTRQRRRQMAHPADLFFTSSSSSFSSRSRSDGGVSLNSQKIPCFAPSSVLVCKVRARWLFVCVRGWPAVFGKGAGERKTNGALSHEGVDVTREANKVALAGFRTAAETRVGKQPRSDSAADNCQRHGK